MVLAAVSRNILHRQSSTIHQDSRLLVVKGVVLLGCGEICIITRNADGTSSLGLSLSISGTRIILRWLSLERILGILLESDPTSMTVPATPIVSHSKTSCFS